MASLFLCQRIHLALDRTRSDMHETIIVAREVGWATGDIEDAYWNCLNY